MKLNLTSQEATEIDLAVREVFTTGHRWEAPLLHHPAGALIKTIAKIRGVTKVEQDSDNGPDGFSTNGWEWDWWQRFGYKGKNYILSGSGHLGGHSFGLEDE